MTSTRPKHSGRKTWRKVATVLSLLLLVAVGVFWKSLYITLVVRVADQQLSMSSLATVRRVSDKLKTAEARTGGESGPLQFVLGRAARRLGNIDDALEHFRRAEQLGYSAEEIRHQRQLVLFQRGHLDPSGELNRMLRQDLSDDKAYEVYEAVAKGYLFSYRFKDAMQLLNFWIEWRQDATDPRIWLAGIWEQTESWSKAVDEYRSVLSIEPQNLEARLALARILMTHLNQFEAAQSELEKCLQIAPDDHAAQIGMAACERSTARPESAERRLRAVILADPPADLLNSARMELGQTLLDQQKTVEAVELLEQVVVAMPQDSSAQYALASALAASGQQEKAQQHFEQSRTLVAQFGRLSEITSALVNQPENANLRWEAGDILMQQGLTSEGAAWMSTALIYEPDHQKTHQSLATYYETIKPDARMAEQHRAKLKSPAF